MQYFFFPLCIFSALRQGLPPAPERKNSRAGFHFSVVSSPGKWKAAGKTGPSFSSRLPLGAGVPGLRPALLWGIPSPFGSQPQGLPPGRSPQGPSLLFRIPPHSWAGSGWEGGGPAGGAASSAGSAPAPLAKRYARRRVRFCFCLPGRRGLFVLRVPAKGFLIRFPQSLHSFSLRRRAFQAVSYCTCCSNSSRGWGWCGKLCFSLVRRGFSGGLLPGMGLWKTCGKGSGADLFHFACAKRKLNVENSVERVESFCFSPQYLGHKPRFPPCFSPYFGLRVEKTSGTGGQARTFLMMSLTVSRRCWSFFMSRSMVFRE